MVLPISLTFGVKHHFCHAHQYCDTSVSCPPLIYFINYIKQVFLPEAKITFLVISLLRLATLENYCYIAF